METVGLLHSHSLQMYRYWADQHNLFMPSVKVTQFSSSCFLVDGRRKLSVVSSAYQNNSLTSSYFVQNPSPKLTTEHGFSSDKPVLDVSTVGNMIKEFTDGGLFEDAIRVYVNMLEYGFPIDEFRFFPCLIKAFGSLCDVEKARQIHGHVLKLGFLGDVYVQNSLLRMYWKCGVVEEAIQLFEKMCHRDLVSWNTMISGFCQSGDHLGSLIFLRRMIDEHVKYPNRISCLSALSSCGSIDALIYGREIHGFLVKSGLETDEFLVSGLIEMYMKCSDIRSAQHVFENIVDKESVRGNPVIWNVMVAGYISNEYFSLALELFIDMLNLGIRPDSSTMVAALVLCSQSLDLEVGEQIHGIVFSHGLQNDIRVITAIIEMYFECGDPEAGLKIFSLSQNCSMVMWSSVISNCVQNGYPAEALQLFYDFMLKCGFPDLLILLAVLRACSSLALKSKGTEIHGLAVKLTFDSDMFVGGALVDMYGKCRDMESSQKVFSGLLFRDLVTWNALISGYAQNRCPDEALKALRDMQSEQMRPNTVTAATILSVCALLSVLILCKEVHCYILRQGLECNVLVSNSLIATYAKCGDVNSSLVVFKKMTERDEVSWNSIVLGLGMHGQTDKMFVLFEKMKAAGKKPDHITFTALLSACSHAGRVDMGRKYFKSMIEDYKLQPQVEHYTCMVDLLGRAGHLNEAYDLIKTMPCVPDDRIWGSLLGSCRTHSNEKLAELVANHIFKLAPTNIGYRVLLAKFYELSGKMGDYARVRLEIKDMGLKKQPGCSWIEVNNSIHIFIAGDHSHHQSDDIYSVLENLTLEMKRAGYIPQLQSVNVMPQKTNDAGLLSSENDSLLSPDITM
ncbi:Pentatricopeptide repeat-containing protein [Melia azedarach]|uniref:Pentatricopeptide repeat-containing protein n=1 Tax=Melia azedarach TaxID=155640 RepID=A0ACC1XM65_MELAZ|nr:Pentatricopeptide repeat-containing protein [Melia azedarach]